MATGVVRITGYSTRSYDMAKPATMVGAVKGKPPETATPPKPFDKHGPVVIGNSMTSEGQLYQYTGDLNGLPPWAPNGIVNENAHSSHDYNNTSPPPFEYYFTRKDKNGKTVYAATGITTYKHFYGGKGNVWENPDKAVYSPSSQEYATTTAYGRVDQNILLFSRFSFPEDQLALVKNKVINSMTVSVLSTGYIDYQVHYLGVFSRNDLQKDLSGGPFPGMVAPHDFGGSFTDAINNTFINATPIGETPDYSIIVLSEEEVSPWYTSSGGTVPWPAGEYEKWVSNALIHIPEHRAWMENVNAKLLKERNVVQTPYIIAGYYGDNANPVNAIRPVSGDPYKYFLFNKYDDIRNIVVFLLTEIGYSSPSNVSYAKIVLEYIDDPGLTTVPSITPSGMDSHVGGAGLTVANRPRNDITVGSITPYGMDSHVGGPGMVVATRPRTELTPPSITPSGMDSHVGGAGLVVSAGPFPISITVPGSLWPGTGVFGSPTFTFTYPPPTHPSCFGVPTVELISVWGPTIPGMGSDWGSVPPPVGGPGGCGCPG